MKVLVISPPCLNRDWRTKLRKASQDRDIDITLLVPHRWVVYGRLIAYENSPGENIKVISGRMCFVGHVNRNFFYTGLMSAMSIRPDIIHMEVEPSSLIALEILILKKIFCPRAKIVFQTSKSKIVRDNPVSKMIQRYVLKKADLAFPVSKRSAQFLREKGFKGKVYIHPNGVTLSDFKKMDVSSLRRDLGLDKSFVIGYVGRIVKEKGLEVLLRAVRRLKIDYRLLWIGEGSAKTWLMNLAKELGVEKKLHHIGYRTHCEVPLYLNCMDVFVLPSLTQPWWEEYFGMALIEAMACGVPVIGSTCGAIPSTIDGAGLIFEEGSEQDLADKIERVAKDSKFRIQLVENALKRVKEKYMWDIIAEQTWQVYKDLENEIARKDKRGMA